MTAPTASSMKLRPLKSPSLRTMAHERLRALILDGTFPRGSQLIIEQLADELGISRTPLREALAMLEHEGLVRTERNRGTFVAGITEEESLETMQVREALEALAVRLATPSLPAEEIARLEALFEEHRSRIEQGNMESDRILNLAFHGTIARHSGNNELATLITGYEEHFNLYLIATGRRTKPTHMLASFNEHLAVLHALKRRNAAEAERLMVEHLQASARRGSAVYNEPPGPVEHEP